MRNFCFLRQELSSVLHLDLGLGFFLLQENEHIRSRHTNTSVALTLYFLSKFVSGSNNSNIHGPSEISRRDKIWSTKIPEAIPFSNSASFELEGC